MLSSAVFALLDLIESETDLLRRKVVDGVFVLILMLGAALAVFAGAALPLAALFSHLQILLPPPWASVLLAAVCFALAGGLAWLAYRLRK